MIIRLNYIHLSSPKKLVINHYNGEQTSLNIINTANKIIRKLGQSIDNWMWDNNTPLLWDDNTIITIK